jgi:hypothetical protein
VLIVMCIMSAIGDSSGNSGNSNSIGDLLAGLALIVGTFVLPAFWSGVLYVRQHEHEPERSKRVA